jgi:hypothetical protein
LTARKVSVPYLRRRVATPLALLLEHHLPLAALRLGVSDIRIAVREHN